jgi:hypothetical protein
MSIIVARIAQPYSLTQKNVRVLFSEHPKLKPETLCPMVYLWDYANEGFHVLIVGTERDQSDGALPDKDHRPGNQAA